MGRNLEFDSQVLELNSRFLPKASLPLCLGYSLPKKEKKFLTSPLETCEPVELVHLHSAGARDRTAHRPVGMAGAEAEAGAGGRRDPV